MKTCIETKIFLRSWLGVWLVEEETFTSYMLMRLMLKGSNVWESLFLQAMSGCTKALEESPEIKNTEIRSMESCSHQSIAKCTHEGQAAVLGSPLPFLPPYPGCTPRR